MRNIELMVTIQNFIKKQIYIHANNKNEKRTTNVTLKFKILFCDAQKSEKTFSANDVQCKKKRVQTVFCYEQSKKNLRASRMPLALYLSAFLRQKEEWELYWTFHTLFFWRNAAYTLFPPEKQCSLKAQSCTNDVPIREQCSLKAKGRDQRFEP